MIKIYQLISRFILRSAQFPVFAATTCKFYPSCSEYADQAINEEGLVRGSLKAIWRVLRCNPFNAGGVDFPSKNK